MGVRRRAAGARTAAVALLLPLALACGDADAAGAVAQAGPAPHRRADANEVDPGTVGMSADTLRHLDALLDSAVAAGAVPGAALAVGRHGRLVRLRGYGVLDPGGSTPATPSTLWDLASLTKVVGTTTAVMRLVDQGRVGLDDPVAEHLPWWAPVDPSDPLRAAKSRVTVRDLLAHRAGLAPFRRWFLEIRGREAYREALAAEPLERPPGGETRYSDLGVMTLAFLVEAVEGRPLDRVLADEVFGPLGMTDTRFNPPDSLRPRIAPTEVDTAWRGRHLRGEVHDENAWALGGVAGHAGLFSSARDLAAFAQLLLDGGAALPCDPGVPGAPCRRPRSDTLRLLAEETVNRFTTPVSDGSTRALGWDTPGDRSSAGDFFTGEAFGHTGFTGTSLWIDPALDLFVVLLTNRVNPTRENTAHVPLRQAVHDAAAQAITDRRVPPRPGSPSAGGPR